MLVRHRIIVVGLLFVAGLIAPGGVAAEDERIVRFESDIAINDDTSLTVTETITVHAKGNRIERGIFRDFPQLYGSSATGIRRGRGFEVFEVTRNGEPEYYVIERLKGGKRLRIGLAERRLSSGRHTYQIKYRTTRQLGYFDEHDELYWNVTGNGWDYQIDEVVATVMTPGGAKVISSEAYTGKVGSKERAYRQKVDAEAGQVRFETARPLGRQEGITVVVAFPKGHLDYAADGPDFFTFVRDNAGLLLVLFGLVASLLYFGVRWVQVGKDPAAGTIIPRYEPPEGFSPAAVRMLSRMAFDEKCFGAAVIGLAAKGAIRIEESGETYRLVKVEADRRADSNSLLTPDEAVLLSKLLRSSSSIVLLPKNHGTISIARESMRIQLSKTLEKSHFLGNSTTWFFGLILFLVPTGLGMFIYDETVLGLFIGSAIASTIAIAGVSMAVSGWQSGVWSVAKSLLALACVAMLAVVVGAHVGAVGYLLAAVTPLGLGAMAIFYHLMKAPTRLGRKRLDEIDGFKRYLSVAEKERLNFENPPQQTPQLFEKFLPYALALGVEQEWSEQFTEVLAEASKAAQDSGSRNAMAVAYTPSFYQGSNFKGLAVGAMATAIGSTLASNLASASVSPSSSSGSSGSGFSSGGSSFGGGSSGGGGGGGGGGGW